MKRGLFIAFEGMDGCGKTTQVWKLAKHIFNLDKHNHVIVTREPWKNRDIRKILQGDNDPYGQAGKLAHLFIQDRKSHIRHLIAPNIRTGALVISDRYSFSTLGYQQTQGFPLWKLIEMHKGLPVPDIIFLVDVPAKEAVRRMKNDKNERAKKHKFEKDIKFMQKLRQNYLKLATINNHNVVILDGTKSINHIFEKQIVPAFNEFYNEKNN